MTGWVLLGIIVAIVGYVVSLYNGLINMRQRARQAFADIDVQLKQRHDLIPNLVETVKGYASHEKDTLEAVVQARNAATSSNGPNPQAEANLTGALGRLMMLSEAYPDLKANTNFQQLQGELSDIENKLAAARRFFNNAVTEYNAGIENFPAVIIARNFNFQAMQLFDIGEDTRKQLDQAPPQVKF